MRVIIFDTEHTEGVFHPWEENFVLSCIRYHTEERWETLWFDHKNIPADLFHYYSPDSWLLLQSLVNKADIIVGHNLKHDMIVAQYCGNISFEGKQLWDTMVCEYLLSGQDPKREFNLDALALHYNLAGKLKSAKEYWDAGIHTYDIPYDVLDEYVTQDVELTRKIFEIQFYETQNTQIRKVIELQNEFIFSLVDMEVNGLKIDQEKGEELYLLNKKRMEEIEEELCSLFGDRRINVQSNDHLSACLYGGEAVIKWKEWITKTLKSRPETKYYEKEFSEVINMPRLFDPIPRTETKKKGYWKTDKEIIAQLKSRGKVGRRIKSLLIEMSNVAKVVETLRGKKSDAGLLNKVAPDGCVHTFFNNAFTTTGRLSSSKPNLMNMPREGTSPIKSVVVSHLDGILQWDLSQIEWRVVAWLSRDPTMITEIKNKVDQHIAACVEWMELPFISKTDPESKMNRFHAKVFNFRMIYGGSFWGFYLDSNMPRFIKKKWKEICDAFYSKYAIWVEWTRTNIGSVWSNNGWLTIPTGRKFRFHKSVVSDGVPSYPENCIKNYPVQGMSGADILPLACVMIRRWLKNNNLKSKLILTVHDSIVFSYANDELKLLVSFLEKFGPALPVHISDYFQIDFDVPLDGECEYGYNYGSLTPVRSEEL